MRSCAGRSTGAVGDAENDSGVPSRSRFDGKVGGSDALRRRKGGLRSVCDGASFGGSGWPWPSLLELPAWAPEHQVSHRTRSGILELFKRCFYLSLRGKA
jgi:hypothetical protein